MSVRRHSVVGCDPDPSRRRQLPIAGAAIRNDWFGRSRTWCRAATVPILDPDAPRTYAAETSDRTPAATRNPANARTTSATVMRQPPRSQAAVRPGPLGRPPTRRPRPPAADRQEQRAEERLPGNDANVREARRRERQPDDERDREDEDRVRRRDRGAPRDPPPRPPPAQRPTARPARHSTAPARIVPSRSVTCTVVSPLRSIGVSVEVPAAVGRPARTSRPAPWNSPT